MPKTTRRALLQARGVHWNGIRMTFLLYLLARFILGLRGPVTLLWLGGTTTATTETGVLQVQVRNCGAVFLLICDKLTFTFYDLNGY